MEGEIMYIVPKPIKIKILENYRIWIKFENEEKKIFDMKKYINEKFYQKLRNEEYFKKVKIFENTIQWENGEDIAPENLYYDSIAEKEI
jgi:hypothetical protein